MYDQENTLGGHSAHMSNSAMLSSIGPGGIVDTHTSNQHSPATGFTKSYGQTSKSKAISGSTNGNPDKMSSSQSSHRAHLSEQKSASFKDLIQKGRQARADDERDVYETKKARLEADRAKAARARLATDNAIHNLALESRSDIDKSKEKLIADMEKNLRALIEAEFRADIREKVYEDEQKIRAVHEREIKDSTRMRLEADLEPVIVADLQAKYEEDVMHSLRAELKAGVKEELRAECKADIKEELRDELESVVREELRAECKADIEEELRDELECVVRKELEDMYREEVRSELKHELSSSVRAEMMDRLGLQHSFPALVDLENEEPSDPEHGNADGPIYNGNYQGYGGESQYDEDEGGEDVFDDAPEEQGNGAVDNFSSSTIDADRLVSNLKDTEDIFNSANGPENINDPVNQDKHSSPSTGADQSGMGFASASSGHLKRHIDENYDEFDEEGTSDVDRPAEKKVKLSPQNELTAETGLPSAVNTNGEYQNEHSQDSGARVLEESEDRLFSRLNDHINLHLGEQQTQEEGEKKADADFPHLNGNVNAFCDTEESYGKATHEETEGHSPFPGAIDTSPNANLPYGIDDQEEHRLYPNLNDFDSEYPPHEHSQSNEDPFAEKQYQTLDDEEVDNTAHQDPELTYDTFDRDEFDRDEERESDAENSEGGDRLGDEGEEYEEDDEDCSVGQNGPADLHAHEPFGNYYQATQVHEGSRPFQNYSRHPASEEDEEATDEEKYNEFGQIHEQVQVPFGGQYRVKRARDEEDDLEEEENAGHYSKRYRSESYSGSEEEYDSESASTQAEDESPGQDTLRPGNPYAVISQTNTQDDPFVIESSDDEDNSPAVDDEKTLVEEHLVEEKIFSSAKEGIYEEDDEESLFVT